ncbi:hypothetical protein RRG08_045411 [Elysia crispata]|uniref:Uncharacterized protein n=1 Tax=Elysia crispata TaxID=231223 RepID=A0AAE0XMB7_9GAST|nr:hypothetical protein RRG08_045411 [Elysia crispata]
MFCLRQDHRVSTSCIGDGHPLFRSFCNKKPQFPPSLPGQQLAFIPGDVGDFVCDCRLLRHFRQGLREDCVKTGPLHQWLGSVMGSAQGLACRALIYFLDTPRRAGSIRWGQVTAPCHSPRQLSFLREIHRGTLASSVTFHRTQTPN